VESFGAVGDWNGSTGTDNTTAINNCIAAVAAAKGGTCTLLAKAYKITGPLTITSNNVSLSGATTCTTNSAAFTAPPTCSNIVQTTAGSDIIDITGTSAVLTIGFNNISNLRLTRSVLPTGSAKGLAISFSYGAQVTNVYSEDSFYDFYFKGVGSAGTGVIENCEAAWGYNGITELAGSYYGFYVDSTGAIASPSLRIRHTSAASNISSGITTYGYVATGTLVSDLHLLHPESANTNYGLQINSSGIPASSSTDIQAVDLIFDGCSTFCIQINGVVGTLQITGGWTNTASTATQAIDIESSSNVSIVNHGVFLAGASKGILVNGSTNVVLAETKIIAVTGSPIVSFTNSSQGALIAVSVTGNTAATGYSFDASSHNNYGLGTVQCISGVTTCLTDNGGQYISLAGAVVFSKLPTCVAGLEGVVRPVSDSNTAVFNANVAGGGANHIIAYCNGSNWVAH